MSRQRPNKETRCNVSQSEAPIGRDDVCSRVKTGSRGRRLIVWVSFTNMSKIDRIDIWVVSVRHMCLGITAMTP
jgi:hypothetical protein